MNRRLALAVAAALLVAGCGSPVPSPVAPTTPLASGPGAGSPGAAASSTPPASAPGSSSAAPASPSATPKPTPRPTPKPVAFRLTSPAFAAGGSIPAAYTCDGAGGSPALAWSGVPAGANALELVVTDPDAGGFVHWIVIDIGADEHGLPRGAGTVGSAWQQGTNSFGAAAWGGPCPPGGTHRYRFTLYALARPIHLAGHPGIGMVRAALDAAKTLKTVTLQATYHR